MEPMTFAEAHVLVMLESGRRMSIEDIQDTLNKSIPWWAFWRKWSSFGILDMIGSMAEGGWVEVHYFDRVILVNRANVVGRDNE
jgi:hypothetical protein